MNRVWTLSSAPATDNDDEMIHTHGQPFMNQMSIRRRTLSTLAVRLVCTVTAFIVCVCVSDFAGKIWIQR